MDTEQSSPALTRRRFIGIAAAAAGLALVPGAAGRTAVGEPAALRVWRGIALGADAMLQIHHPDSAAAERLIRISLAEVARLERIFSLYRPDSALSRLNRDGRLAAPPPELVELLASANQFSTLTGGAFDATVQPLWALYATHFARADAEPDGPPAEAVAAALRLVDYRALEISPRHLRFARPGMAVTLNGIAQGYITDRIVDLLRDAGLDRSLVDMGEVRAIGGRPGGGPWVVGLEDPVFPREVAERIAIENRAVATSGGYGTRFDPAGRFNHIFDPCSGESSCRLLSVSVVAPLATTADALSTAFSVLPPSKSFALARQAGVAVHLAYPDGSRSSQPA